MLDAFPLSHRLQDHSVPSKRHFLALPATIIVHQLWYHLHLTKCLWIQLTQATLVALRNSVHLKSHSEKETLELRGSCRRLLPAQARALRIHHTAGQVLGRQGPSSTLLRCTLETQALTAPVSRATV